MAGRKKHRWMKWAVLAVIALVAAGLLLAAALRQGQGAYTEVAVRRQDLSTWYSFVGAVQARDKSAVTAGANMQIRTVHVQEGGSVKKGDVLFEVTLAGAGGARMSEIKAPQDGEVGQVAVHEGDSVMAGAALTTVTDYGHLLVRAKVDEYDVAALQTGKQVEVRFDSLNKTVRGNVQRVSREATIEDGVSYFSAVVELQDSSGLYAGVSAEVRMLDQQVRNVLTLPVSALQFDEANQPYVFLRGEQGKPRRQQVQVGLSDGSQAQISQGLREGDVVLEPRRGAHLMGMSFVPAGLPV